MTAEPTEDTATIAPTVTPLSRITDVDPKPPFKFKVFAPSPAPVLPNLKSFDTDLSALVPNSR